MATKQSYNYINSEGNSITTFSKLSKVFFLQKLLGTVDDKVTRCARGIFEDLLQTPLSMEASSELTAPVSPNEIKNTIFVIGGDKTPGPDGFTLQFFKIDWSIVGG